MNRNTEWINAGSSTYYVSVQSGELINGSVSVELQLKDAPVKKRGDIGSGVKIIGMPVTSAAAGVVLRYENENSFAACLLTIERLENDEYRSYVSLWRPGRGKPLAVCMAGPVAADIDKSHRLEIVVYGDQYMAVLNGKPITQWKLPDLNGKKIGIIVAEGSAQFDGLEVSDSVGKAEALLKRGPFDIERNKQGEILPMYSYNDMVLLPIDWALWFAENAAGKDLVKGISRDDSCYLDYYGFSFNGHLSDAINYPPEQYSSYLFGIYAAYLYTGGEKYLAAGQEIIDSWLRPDRSAPDDWALPGIPVSTIEVLEDGLDIDQHAREISFANDFTDGRYSFRSDGRKVSVTENQISISSIGLMGFHLVRWSHLYRQDECLAAAGHFADTLIRLQKPDGTFPFRIDCRTGEEFGENISISAYVIMFLDALLQIEENERYRGARERAWKVLLDGPIQTQCWQGSFEDHTIGDSSNVISYRSAVLTSPAIAQLIAGSDTANNYLELASKNADWIMDNFCVKGPMGEILAYEQTMLGEGGIFPDEHMDVMPGWGSLYGYYWAFDLADRTGNDTYKEMIRQLLNSATYWMNPSGLLRTYTYPLEDDYRDGGRPTLTIRQWFSLQMVTSVGYLRAMADDPALAPDGENHLLHITAPLTALTYSKDRVEYSVSHKSADIIKLVRKPVSITLNGKEITEGEDGWIWNESNFSLKIVHEKGRLVITIGG